VNSAICVFFKAGHAVIFVRHENKQLVALSDEWQIDQRILQKDTDKVFSKQKGDAFSNPSLVAYLKKQGITDVVVGGLVSHGCVKHTCFGGTKAGFRVSLLKGGHTCWNRDAKEKIASVEHSLLDSGIVTVLV
jgi:nicotinamidase-related amidase